MQAKHATPTPYLEQIRLERLEIRNFKGCESLTLDLGGKSASIYGDNAAGKTTLYDAIPWLLFGKDSSGAGKFNIKPLNDAGEVADHAAETSVEAELTAGGVSVVLKRTYKELWTKKRGRKEAVFDGHTSEFFYNGLPVQKQDFEGRVAQLCDEVLVMKDGRVLERGATDQVFQHPQHAFTRALIAAVPRMP
jgi:DNA repair exonuclease SbcCD ATPase subunit